MEEWAYISMYSSLQHYLHISDKLNVPTALPSGKMTTLTFGYETRWAL
jgi:hypothetical protein